MVRAAVTAVVAALAVLLTPMPAHAAPAGPGAAAGFFTFGGGSALEGTGAVADFGRGYDVRVDPAAPHAAGIADAVEYAVAQLQKYGIEARYRGIGTAPASASSYGRITVGEATDAAQDDCLHATSADSGAVTEGVALPSFQDVGIAVRVNSAQVTFCPPVWSHDQHYVTAIALHELGHAVGLGHYPSTYRGAVQVMNPIVPDVSTYQAGDVNGLRYLVAQTARLRAASVLDGAVESWTVSRAGLATTGWAIVGTTFQFADIAVTRDGEAVYNITTGAPRPDISARYDARWPNSGFVGSHVPMADGTHRYCVRASAPSDPEQVKLLGCRDLSYPPPVTRAPQPAPVHTAVAVGAVAERYVWWVVAGGAAAVLVLVALGVVALRRTR